MENIKTLEDVYKILYLKQCNKELLSVVKVYFVAHNPICKQIVKFYYYNAKQAKFHFNTSATEYEKIRYKICTDIANLVWDYYKNRANTIENLDNVTDLITYRKTSSKKLKK